MKIVNTEGFLDKETVDATMDSIYAEYAAMFFYQNCKNAADIQGYAKFLKTFFETESKQEWKHSKKLTEFLNEMDVAYAIDPSEIKNVYKELKDCTPIAMVDKALELEKELGDHYITLYKNEKINKLMQPLLLELIEIQKESIGEMSALRKRIETTKDLQLFDLM